MVLCVLQTTQKHNRFSVAPIKTSLRFFNDLVLLGKNVFALTYTHTKQCYSEFCCEELALHRLSLVVDMICAMGEASGSIALSQIKSKMEKSAEGRQLLT